MNGNKHLVADFGDFKDFNNVSLRPKTSTEEGIVPIDRIKKTSLAVSLHSEYNRQSKISISVLRQESIFQTIWQISVPFFIASMGSIGAGVVLDSVQDSEAFQEHKALYVCVPALLGLKGNLDMCLASRLSTQANLGHMSSKRNVIKMAIGNIAIVQVQAICAALFISFYSLLMTIWIHNTGFTMKALLVVATSSFLTATISCFVLDFLIVVVIYLSYKYKINPDNICSPIVASVGDVASMGFFAIFSNSVHTLIGKDIFWFSILVLCVYTLILLPLWLLVVHKNIFAHNILMQGWIPVFVAVTISGTSGIILKYAVDIHEGFSSFQTVVNGVGGDIVSIYSSRVATFFHLTAKRGQIPSLTKIRVPPWKALIQGTFPAKTVRLLIPIAIVGQTVFVNIADVIQNSGTSRVSAVFYFSYIIGVFIQLLILLYAAHFVTHLLWKFKMDPDSTAVPYLTAFADLLGTSLLFAAFSFSSAVGHPYLESAKYNKPNIN